MKLYIYIIYFLNYFRKLLPATSPIYSRLFSQNAINCTISQVGKQIENPPKGNHVSFGEEPWSSAEVPNLGDARDL
jgi:hypothetical protein